MPNPMNGRFAALYKGTPSEHALEPAVAALGVPYRTNFPLYLYEGGLSSFPDFLIPSLQIVIEVDGTSHRDTEQEDMVRAMEMNRVYGWRTFRVSNAVAEADPFGVVTQILQAAGLERPVAPARGLGLPPAKQHRGKRSSQQGRGQPTRGASASTRSPKARTRAKRGRSASGQPKSPR